MIRAPSFRTHINSFRLQPPSPSALLQDLRSYPLNLSTGMSGTILQAEIDSNHQFVRKKGYLTDKWLKINNLSVKRWVFTDKLCVGPRLFPSFKAFPFIPPWRCLCGSEDRRERGHCHGRSPQARKATPRDRNASISPEGERFPRIWPAFRDYGHR